MGGAFFLGAALVGYFLAAGWIIWSLVGACVMREITVAELVLYGGLYLVFALGSVATWGSPLGAGFLLMAVISVIGYPIIQRVHNQTQIREMQLTDLHDNLKRIDERPDIPYSYQKVADIYFDRGDYAQALEYYGRLAKLENDANVKWRMRKCQDEVRRAQTGEKPCIYCGADNAPGARVCAKCGKDIPSSWDFLEPFRGKKALSYVLYTLFATLGAGILLGVLTSINAFWLSLFFLAAMACFFVYLYVRLST